MRSIILWLMLITCVWADEPKQKAEVFKEPSHIIVWERIVVVLQVTYNEDGQTFRVDKHRVEYVPHRIPNPRAKK